ncbi:MAG TPA: family 16 glycoside hydrolase, partial [Steroidobacteraceae bacterium]|nr:family 16 glycoside hydrolase [Steroidobacteraceae bacterium]
TLAAVLSPHNNALLPSPAVQLFSRGSTPASWTQEDRLNAGTGHIFARLALRGGELFVTGFPRHGIARFQCNGGTWTEEGRLTTAGDFVAIREFGVLHGPIVGSDTYVLHLAWDYELGGHLVQVFQPTAAGGWRHAATLRPRSSAGLHENIAVSGRRVLVTGFDQIYYFELPATLVTPSVQQDTFTSSNGADWTQTAGSQFAVVRAGYSRVFRQSSLAGDAVAIRDMSNWANQSIQADVTIRQVNGQNRWAGLAIRHSDAANFYYITLRSTGALELKRMRDGVFSTISSGSVPFALNNTYRLRLESVGALLNVYFDGSMLLSTGELEPPLPPGRAALMTYRAAADFDNVVISPTPATTIYTQSTSETFNEPNLEPWQYQGGRWAWVDEGEDGVFQQQLVTGDARAFVGAHTEDADQTVQSRVRVDAFDTGNGDPWVGLMSRAADPNNYTYLSLRRSGTLTLRKLVNGQIQALGTANVSVSPGAWVRLRLETVGARVRAYVNGTLVLQADDPDFTTGRTGLLTYRTRASFDDFKAIRP